MDEVVNALKGKVTWSVIKSADGSVVPNGEVEGLKVVVVEESVVLAVDESEFPAYGEDVLHPEITA